MKTFISTLLFFVTLSMNAQYIGVKAKYVATRLVPNPGHNDSREDRLVLSFFDVDPFTFEWTPISVSNYPMYIKPTDLQLNWSLDSTGNNYPGYNYPAPVVASYYNSMGRPYFDCSTYGSVALVANGHELDCGFLQVSQWVDDGTETNTDVEQFTTIDVGLPFYFWPEQYYLLPGNVNFGPNGTLSGFPNTYNFSCGGPLQLVNRGAMWQDTSTSLIPLVVHFANLGATIQDGCKPLVKFSNLTESDIRNYIVEKAVSAGSFVAVDSLLPTANNGSAADYSWQDSTTINGFNLYRIKAIENTGRFYYSMVLRVNGCPGSGSGRAANPYHLTIYPNPVQNGRFYLNVNDLPAGRYSITLVSALGQQRIITEFDHSGGAVNKLFNLDWMPPGLYTLVLRSDDLQLVTKIIIKE